MKRCRTSVWIASVLLFTVVVSSIFPIRTVSAHGVHDHSHEESVEHVALPKGAVIWEGEDFGSWLSTASVSTAHSQNAQWALVFTSESDYQDWLNSISPEAAELIVNLTMRVKGSKLPNVIVEVLSDLWGYCGDVRLLSAREMGVRAVRSADRAMVERVP
jgi:hypothetical protein